MVWTVGDGFPVPQHWQKRDVKPQTGSFQLKLAPQAPKPSAKCLKGLWKSTEDWGLSAGSGRGLVKLHRGNNGVLKQDIVQINARCPKTWINLVASVFLMYIKNMIYKLFLCKSGKKLQNFDQKVLQP